MSPEEPSAPPASSIQILVPTWLEYVFARSALRGMDVVRAGVRLATWKGAPAGSTIVVCGLAGGLGPGVPPGTVAIPREVRLPGGSTLHCDPELVAALSTAAHSLRYEIDNGPLLTAPTIVTGSERQRWRERGFSAADMETGLLAGHGYRVAAVRVILDTPERGISEDWLEAGRALLRPRLWGEMLWMAQMAPRYALRAARVLRSALDSSPVSM